MHFKLPVVPYVEHLAVLQMMDQNVLKDEVGKEHICTTSGFSIEDVATSKSNKHDRPPINGTEPGITSFIKVQDLKSKAEKQLDEAENAKAQAKEYKANVKAVLVGGKG